MSEIKKHVEHLVDVSGARWSEEVAALFAALAAAQLEMGPAHKDGKNPHFRSSYVTLGSVLSAVLPPLNRNGIALVQHPGNPDGSAVHVDTMLTHKSGQWMMSRCSIRLERKKDAHAVASAITYLRRFGAQSICGLPSLDDDGNSTVGIAAPRRVNSPPPSTRRAPDPDPHHESWTASERKWFCARLQDLGSTYDSAATKATEMGQAPPRR